MRKGEIPISRKSLPLAEPVITGYHYRAMPLSIIGTHDACFSWILQNFIQLRCHKNIIDQQAVLDFADPDGLHFPTPWLDIQRIERAFFDHYLPDLKQFVIHCLQNGYYVHLYLDEFFVPDRSPFGIYHVPHDILIAGYDDESASFEVAGFDEQGRYKQTRLAYQQFYDATANASRFAESQNPLLLLQLNPAAHSDFSLAKIIRWLTAYLHAEDCCNHYTMVASDNAFAYGLDVYEALCTYLQCAPEQHIQLETRPFQILLERNQLMQRRLFYLQEHNYLDDAQRYIQVYKELEKSSQTVRNGMIKYQLTGMERPLQRMQDQLLAMQTKERAIMQELLQGLRSDVHTN